MLRNRIPHQRYCLSNLRFNLEKSQDASTPKWGSISRHSGQHAAKLRKSCGCTSLSLCDHPFIGKDLVNFPRREINLEMYFKATEEYLNGNILLFYKADEGPHSFYTKQLTLHRLGINFSTFKLAKHLPLCLPKRL